MSDIGLTRRLGDGSVARPQGAGAATAATATVANLPAGLVNVAAGTLIKALVTSQNGRGLTLLQTDQGTLTLQTGVPLKPGNELVLQVQSAGTQVRMVILSVDHRPLSKAQQTSRTAAQAPATATTTTASQHGAGDTALRGETQLPPPPPAPTGYRPATDGPVPARGEPPSGPARGIGPAPSAAAGDAVRGAMTPGLVIPGRVLTGGVPAAAVPGTSQPRALGTGDVLTIRILAAGPGTEPVPPAPNGSSVLRGTIAPTAPGVSQAPAAAGAAPPSTILAVGGAHIALAAPPPGRPGADVTFQILETRSALSAEKPSAHLLHRDFLRLGTEWRSLKDAVDLIAAPGGAPANDGQDAIPRADSRMASAILFFMAALKGGNVRAWLGDVRAEQLARFAQGQLLAQLSDDFAAMARHAEAAPGGWHSLAVPVSAGAHAEQFRLYYRRRNGGTGEEDGNDATHFVVEADLSRIGMLQLEGLVRPRRFDLAVRGTATLDATMQADIRQIFHEALALGDLAGTIRFDADAPPPFAPPGTALRPTGNTAAVVV